MIVPFTSANAFDEWARERNWPAHCDPGLAFDAPILHDLLRIWRDRAGGDSMPSRANMSARALKAHLKHIAIIEAEGSRYRFRLLGTTLAQYLGEVQGKYLDEAISPEVVPHWHARLDLVIVQRRPLRFVSRVDANQLYFLRSESLWAPLTDGHGLPTQVLMGAKLSFDPAAAGAAAAHRYA